MNPTIPRLPTETFCEWILRMLEYWERTASADSADDMEPEQEFERRTR